MKKQLKKSLLAKEAELKDVQGGYGDEGPYPSTHKTSSSGSSGGGTSGGGTGGGGGGGW